jgi:hypothetical protein
MLQYVSSGTYYARLPTGGKIIRESLVTTVWTTAQLKLVDFLKAKQTPKANVDKPKIAFRDAVELFKIGFNMISR